MRKKKELPLLENITITAIAAEGKALARVDDKVVFVPFVVPGDVVDLQVKRKKNSFMEAEAVRFHQRSPLRAEPFCQHYGVCGGCKWQCLQYEEQLKAKQQQVVDNLQRIGKVELPEISPILGSAHTRAYRNKLEFGFSNKRWLTQEEVDSDMRYGQMNALGFHVGNAFDKILDIRECHLMDDINNRIRNEVRQYAIDKGMAFYDIRNQKGLLRNIMLRNSDTGELMVVVIFRMENEDDKRQAMGMMEHLSTQFPEITSLLYVDNHKCNDTFGDLEVHTFRGHDHIFEVMEDLRFKVGQNALRLVRI